MVGSFTFNAAAQGRATRPHSSSTCLFADSAPVSARCTRTHCGDEPLVPYPAQPDCLLISTARPLVPFPAQSACSLIVHWCTRTYGGDGPLVPSPARPDCLLEVYWYTRTRIQGLGGGCGECAASVHGYTGKQRAANSQSTMVTPCRRRPFVLRRVAADRREHAAVAERHCVGPDHSFLRQLCTRKFHVNRVSALGLD